METYAIHKPKKRETKYVLKISTSNGPKRELTPSQFNYKYTIKNKNIKNRFNIMIGERTVDRSSSLKLKYRPTTIMKQYKQKDYTT